MKDYDDFIDVEDVKLDEKEKLNKDDSTIYDQRKTKIVEDADVEDDKEEDDYEDICFLCHRPESKVGKMFKLPNNISVCNDCMHKTLDTMSQFDYQDILSNPALGSGAYLGNIFQGMGNLNGKDGNDMGANPGSKADKVAGNGSQDHKEANLDGDDSEQEDENANINMNTNRGRFPNISFVNLADLQNMGAVPNRQKLKKKKKEGSAPVIDLKKIPAPHKIKAQLDEYIIGQDQAKKVVSVAVYNHYKRVATNTMDDIEIEKSNMLMIGPTGCGKTYLVKTLARLLDVPLAIADATSLTEAGYIGDDIESVISKLLAAADNDVEKAERGIVFIDEIDKLARKKETTSRDVSGESVQQGLLKLLEGAEVEVPVGANSKNAMVPLTTVNTKNILFICGGAFPDLEDIIKQRLNHETSIGYTADLKDKYDKEKDILSKVTIEDIKKFGMIPEFVGRLPILFTLRGLDKDALIKILKEPKNAILKQYQKLLELDEVKLEFDDGALEAIAEKALKKETGARALRSIIEEFMLDIMYEIPKDDNIGRVIITKEYIEGTGGPVIDIRNNDVSLSELDSMKEITDQKEIGVEAI